MSNPTDSEAPHPEPAADTPTGKALTRPERLDRLPWTRLHTKILGGSGVGWALDAMDVGLISFIMTALAAEWGLASGELSLLASVGFVGMAIGASVGGLLADRIGRKQVFALTLLIYGIATGLSAFSTGLVMLIAFRFVVGLGLGAELPVASTLVSEFAPRAIRGRVVVILESFWAVGWLTAALIGYFVVPTFENGWRWALLIGAVPALWALVVRAHLPESVRFLEARGRTDEAEAVVREFEDVAGVEPVPSPALPPANRIHWRELWTPRYRKRTIALSLTWIGVNFSYYGAFIWLPTLLYNQGYDIVRSFQYTLIITLAQLPGYALAAFLIERWGRRPTLATFLAGSALSAVAFGFSPNITLLLISGSALSFFNLGAWGALYAITPEVYPTSHRGTGSGAATAFGRLAAMTAPLVVPPLVALGGLPVLFGVLGASFLMAMVACLFLPEMADLALEER
ncbi:MAG TPA: MFS transporter [Actinomycetaceae bacterium]|nr:MFS transporter [Actinomycetaceae bacterium]